jgi:hypothetical protein
VGDQDRVRSRARPSGQQPPQPRGLALFGGVVEKELGRQQGARRAEAAEGQRRGTAGPAERARQHPADGNRQPPEGAPDAARLAPALGVQVALPGAVPQVARRVSGREVGRRVAEREHVAASAQPLDEGRRHADAAALGDTRPPAGSVLAIRA